MSIINITISPSGATKVDVEGGDGQSCSSLTEPLLEKLQNNEGQVTRELKPEWYNTTEIETPIYTTW